ncbi:DNA-binding protein [Alsobacter soli]|uniref:DNA-binding protein n=1 Tax=Alsobacter soli TaxID=2109933 RepID=A0A2T1HWD0_9HYPH|nr:helix-turn-helix domain-containing protein [Alsobacter soli]PSC05982.1 DNA-binding protein [Alsobacter soli]
MKYAISVKEVCRMLSLGPTKVNELLKSGELPSVKIGRRRLVWVEDVHRLVAKNRSTGPDDDLEPMVPA